jgi:formyltetrahydrofolate synthetase
MYDLVGNYNQVWQMLNNEDTDLQVINDTLQSIECAIEVKAQNTVLLLKNLEVYSNGIDTEIKRLQTKKTAADNKYEYIKSYLLGQIELTGLAEIKTTIATIKKQKNPQSVEIFDESLIPAKFQTVVPQTYKISKAEISKELKAGIEVPGAKLIQSQRWIIK